MLKLRPQFLRPAQDDRKAKAEAPIQTPAAAPRFAGLRTLRLGLGELVLAGLGYLAYSLSCGAVHAHRGLAFANAERIIALERGLRLLVEPAMQRPVLSHPWLVQLFDGIYIWGHLPLIIMVAIWLFALHRAQYRVIRNAVLISGALALVGFYGFPVAPPRFIPSLQIVDTAALVSPVYDTLEPKVFFNPYAAIPSMHLAWDLLMGIALICCASRVALRWFGVLLPLGMLVAVVVTGNHYVVDAFAGVAVALAGLAAALGLERLRIGHGITTSSSLPPSPSGRRWA